VRTNKRDHIETLLVILDIILNYWLKSLYHFYSILIKIFMIDIDCVPKLTDIAEIYSVCNVNYRFLTLAVNFGTQPTQLTQLS